MSEDMSSKRAVAAYVALFVLGILVEIVVAMSTGARESWDSEVYWSVGLPTMFVATFAAGFFGYGTSLIHGIVVVAGQFIAMMIRTGEIGSLLFLGIILSAILGGIISIGSIAGSAVKRFFDK